MEALAEFLNGPCAHFLFVAQMAAKPLTTQIVNIVEPVIHRLGYVLWGVEINQGAHSAFLRVYIDKTEGITVDDCGIVSQQISGLLNVEQPIRTPYTLEVSSPGLDRPLMNKEHYETVIGGQIKLRLRSLVDGRRKLVGKLCEIGDDHIILEEDQGLRHQLPMDVIDSARVVPDFSV